MIWHQHPFQKHFPLQIHLQVQSTLKHLDLHGNRISTISDSQLNQIQSLVMLNLADNQITIIDDQVDNYVPQWWAEFHDELSWLFTFTDSKFLSYLQKIAKSFLKFLLFPFS